MRHFLPLAFAVFIAASLPAHAQSSGPDAIAASIWSKLLTRCGQSYFYEGSVFDKNGLISSPGAPQPSIYEYRGVKFNLVPIRVTDAEKLNGIGYRARISMLAHVFRDRGKGEQWVDGPDLQPRNIDDVLGRVIGGVVGDIGQLGGAGAIAFELVQSKGQWYLARSSTGMSGALSGSGSFIPISRALVGSGDHSCNAIGFRIKQSDIARASADAKRRHDEAIERAYAADGPTHDPVKGIPYRLLSDDDYALIKACYDGALRDCYGDDVHAKAQALVDSYPILAEGDQWLPPGQRFLVIWNFPLMEAFPPTGVRHKSLQLVQLAGGPHARKYALIDGLSVDMDELDADHYGQVWHSKEEAAATMHAREVKAREDDEIRRARLTRDPVKGVPFEDVSDEMDILREPANYTLRYAEQSRETWIELVKNFPETNQRDDQWLAPGTEYEPVCREPGAPGDCGSGGLITHDKFALIRVVSGPHTGIYALIDYRNYASNTHKICDADVPAMRCGP